MQVKSTSFQSMATSRLRAQEAQQNAQATEPQMPTDDVTFSDGSDGAKLFLGMGVMMTGMMFGAQMGTSMAPVVMMGSMFGGMAIMFS